MTARFFAKCAAFVFVPLLIVEVATRLLVGGPLAGTNGLVDFYKPVATHVDTADVDVLFVGSSRVAAAVRPRVFQEAYTERTGESIHVLNAGQGYSTAAIHYYGLTRLLREHPERFEGATVIVEARNGLPSQETWNDAWTHRELPNLLGPYLAISDVPAFIWLSDNEGSAKATVTAGTALMSVRLWKFLRGHIQSVPDRIAERVGAAFSEDTHVQAVSTVDLSSAGGIRTDSAGVAFTREQARINAGIPPVHVPMEDWSETVWADLYDEVRAAGGRMIFFNVKMSTLDLSSYEGPSFEESRDSFNRWAEANGVDIIEAEIRFPDTDYPDYFHLGYSLSDPYTRALADAYADWAKR